MKFFLACLFFSNTIFYTLTLGNTVKADWYCFDKNIGVEVIIFNSELGHIRFSFLNESLEQFSFKTKCTFLGDDGRSITFRCNEKSEYGDFGFGLVRNWNHSIHSAFFYNHHGQFSNTRPIGAEKYNEFLVCNENVEVMEDLD